MTRPAALLALVLFAAPAAAESGDFLYADSATPWRTEGAVVVDARPLAACQKQSLKGARCLPAGDLLGPHRRLPAVPDILWALGTIGLSGAETVLVIGDEPTARDFVAGLLYLGGQRRVVILRGIPTENIGPGAARGITREAVFQAPMRDALWLLRREIAQSISAGTAPVLLDGRGESEFWGETVHATRGGHLPGAESLPAGAARAALGRGELPALPAGDPVTYAHDAVEGIAFFTLLRAGAGVAARVYPGGWAEWAADGGLPADSATYPDRTRQTVEGAPTSGGTGFPWLAVLAAAGLLGAGLAAGGFYLGRRSAA